MEEESKKSIIETGKAQPFEEEEKKGDKISRLIDSSGVNLQTDFGMQHIGSNAELYSRTEESYSFLRSETTTNAKQRAFTTMSFGNHRGDLREKQFYCLLPETADYEQEYNIQARIEVSLKIGEKKILHATMLNQGRGIYFGLLKDVNQRDIRTFGRVKYTYKKLVCKAEKWKESVTLLSQSRNKGFIESDAFFDFLQPNKFAFFKDKNVTVQQISNLVQFFIQHFNCQNIFSNPTLLIELISVIEADQIKCPIYEIIFEGLIKQYKAQETFTPVFLDDIQRYVIQIIANISQATMSQFEEKARHLFELFQFNEFGHFRFLFQKMTDNLKNAFNHLVYFCPRTGLEFLDISAVIPDQNEYLNKFLKTETNHAYMLSSFKHCIQDLNYNEKTVDKMAVALINAAINLQNLFGYTIEIGNLVWSDLIQSTFQKNLSTHNQFKIKRYLIENFDILVQNVQMRKLFMTQLRDITIDSLSKDTAFSRKRFETLLEIGMEIFDKDLIQSLTQLVQNQYLQENLATMIIKLQQSSPKRCSFYTFGELLALNLNSLLVPSSSADHTSVKKKSFLECLQKYEMILNQVFKDDSKKASYVTFMANWNDESLLSNLRQSLCHYLLTDQQSFQETFLQDLSQFLQVKERSLLCFKEAIESASYLISQIKIEERMIKIVIESFYVIQDMNWKNLYAASYVLKIQSTKQIVDQILSKIDVDNESTLMMILNDPLKCVALQIGENLNKSAYLLKIRNTLDDFVTSIESRQITMKVVRDLIVHQPRLALNMCRVINEFFTKEQLITLASVEQFYHFQQQQYRNYLTWADKTPFRETTPSYLEYLNKNDEDYLNITVKQIENKSIWERFSEFKAVDRIFYVRESSLFDNIIRVNAKIQELSPKTLHQFDEIAMEEIFISNQNGHFRDLQNYPESSIEYQVLQKYWQGIPKDRIESEIDILFGYLETFDPESESQPDRSQLSRDLKFYSEFPTFIRSSQIIANLDQFVTNQRHLILESDADYNLLCNFIKFSQTIEQTESLYKIKSEVMEVNRLFKLLKDNSNINFSVLKTLSECRDMFKLYLVASGVDILDFLEQTGQIYSNEVKYSLRSIFHLFHRLESMQKVNENRLHSFTKILEAMTFNFLETTTLEAFTDSIKLVEPHFEQIDSNLRKFANQEYFNQHSLILMKIIAEAESVEWCPNQNFEFNIKLPLDTSSDFSILQGSQLIKILAKGETIAALISKGMLENEENSVQIVQYTADLVKILKSIQHQLRLQSIWKKSSSPAGADTKVKVIATSGQNDILKDVIEFEKQLKLQSDQMLDKQQKITEKFPFLYWLDKYRSYKVIEALEKNDVQGIVAVVIDMVVKDYLSMELNLDKLGKNEIYTIMQTIQQEFNTYLIYKDEKLKLKPSKNENSVQFSTPSQELTYLNVQNQGQMQRLIIKMNLDIGRVPFHSDIMFCNQETDLLDLQMFVQRAISFRTLISKSQQSRMFFIIDFQQLSPFLQFQFEQFLTQKEQKGHIFRLSIVSINPMKEAQNIELPEKLDLLVKRLQKIQFFTSEYSGLGKSKMINEITAKKNQKCNKLPIMGLINKQAVAKSHQTLLKSFIQGLDANMEDGAGGEERKGPPQNSKEKICFCYQICQPKSIEDLNNLLFDILILGCIRVESPTIIDFYYPKWMSLYFEVSNEMKQWYDQSDFSKLGFKIHHITDVDSKKNLNLQSNPLWTDIQMAVDAIQDTKQNKRRLKTTKMLEDFAIDVTKEGLYKNIAQSSYRNIDGFLKLSTKQHNLLKKSDAFKSDSVKDFVRLSLNFKPKESLQIQDNALELQYRFLGLMILTCENLIIHLGQMQENAQRQNQKLNLFKLIQNQSIMFLTNSGALFTIIKSNEDYPLLITNFLRQNSDLFIWSEMTSLTEQEVLQRLIRFWHNETGKNMNVSKASELGFALEESNIALTGYFFQQFICLYLWLQAFFDGSTLLPFTITCSDPEQMKDLILVYSLLLNLDINFIKLDQRDQDQQLEYAIKKSKSYRRTTVAGQNSLNQSGQKMLLVFEDHHHSPWLYQTLREYLHSIKEGSETLALILRHDEGGQTKLSTENGIFVDNFNNRDNHAQTFKFVSHMVKKYITDEKYQEFHHDITIILTRINRSKIIKIQHMKMYTENILQHMQKIMKMPQLFPGNEFISQTSAQQQQSKAKKLMGIAYVKQFSDGKLKLLLNCIVFALAITYEHHSKVDMFWNLLRDAVVQEDNLVPTSELYKVFAETDYEQLVDKIKDHLFRKFLHQDQKLYTATTKGLELTIISVLMSIFMQKPLLVIGHSGNSKSHAVKIVEESLNSPMVREQLGLKMSYRFFIYQASNTLTVEEVNKIFSKVNKLKKKNPDQQPVLIFDSLNFEAQNSEDMALFVEQLAHVQSTSVIGISSSDLIKNEQFYKLKIVRLPKIDRSEISQVAQCIFNSQVPAYQQARDKVLEWFNYQVQNKTSHLRDLYSAFAQIDRALNNSQIVLQSDDVNEIVIEAALKNFAEDQTVQQSFDKFKGPSIKKFQHEITNIQQNNTMMLKSLTHGVFSRQLMIVEDHIEKAINIIVDECEKKEMMFEMFFEPEVTDSQSCRQLFSNILLKMEHGIFCIIVCIDKLIPYLFQCFEADRLNLLKKKIMPITVGKHQTNCVIHHAFKSVVILREEQYQRLSPSYSGIFEVHRVCMKHHDEIAVDEWLKTIKINSHDFNQCLARKLPLDSLLELRSSLVSEKDIAGSLKNQIIGLATFSGILKIDSLQTRQPSEDLFGYYCQQKQQFSLRECIEHYSETWQSDSMYDPSQGGFNLIAYTLSNENQVLQAVDQLGLNHDKGTFFYLKWIQSIDELREKLQSFFEGGESSPTLIGFYIKKMTSQTLNQLKIAKELIRIYRRKFCSSLQQNNKHVVVIVKMKKDHSKEMTIPFRKFWKQQSIEMIEGDIIKNFSTREILETPPKEALLTHTKFISKQQIFAKHLEKNFKNVTYAGYEGQSDFLQGRINLIEKILKKKHNWAMIAELMEQSIENDTENIKLGHLVQDNHRANQDQGVGYSKFNQTKIALRKDYYTYKEIFDPQNWPQSIAYLLLSPYVNTRQQLQMIFLQILMKPVFERHLAKVVLFLEKSNMFIAHQYSPALYEVAKTNAVLLNHLNFILNGPKSVDYHVEDFRTYRFPYFQLIHLIFSIVMRENSEIATVLKNQIEGKLENLMSSNMQMFLEDFIECTINAKKYHPHVKNLKSFLEIAIKSLSPKEPLTSAIDLYRLYVPIQDFMQGIFDLIHQHLHFQLEKLLKDFETQLAAVEEYSPQVFIEITLRVICNSLYPSLELWDEYEIWVKFIEEPLNKIKALAIGHLKDVGEQGTQDTKLIGYIKRFFQSVMPELRYLKANEKVELFVTFSQSLRLVFFTDIEATVNIINDVKKALVKQDSESHIDAAENLLAEVTYIYLSILNSEEAVLFGLRHFTGAIQRSNLGGKKYLLQNQVSSIIKLLSSLISIIEAEAFLGILDNSEVKDQKLLFLIQTLQLMSPLYKLRDSIPLSIIQSLQECFEAKVFTVLSQELITYFMQLTRDLIMDGCNEVNLRLLTAIAFFRSHTLIKYDSTNVLFLRNLKSSGQYKEEDYKKVFEGTREAAEKMNEQRLKMRQGASYDIDLQQIFQ